jgi:pyruvate/2-oxoglutarate dehydrogenase complex dihydrolipoamide acyltransferase (E2) component
MSPDDPMLPISSEVPTAHLTTLCVSCERYVAGTDGDGICPECGRAAQAPLAEGGVVESEEAILIGEDGPEQFERQASSESAGSGQAVAVHQPPSNTQTGGQEPDDNGGPGTIDATPAAIRRAQELGIDLGQVTGTGADGRVTKDDVDQYATQTP